jgi:predicted double-glycine peptidase
LSPLTTAILETLGVLALAASGVLAGRGMARWRSPWWQVATAGLLLGLVLLALPRRIYGLEYVAPFSWLMAGRREFAIMAWLVSAVFSLLGRRLDSPRKRLMVIGFMAIVVIIQGALPFLMPGLTVGRLQGLRTTVDGEGICHQTTGFTCGPAAAVTVLRQLGIHGEEGEIAILAKSSFNAGTGADCLSEALEARYLAEGVRCRFVRLARVSELQGHEPAMVAVKLGMMVDHFVAVLAVTPEAIIVGDPLSGKVTMDHASFEGIWRGGAVLVSRTVPEPITEAP